MGPAVTTGVPWQDSAVEFTRILRRGMALTWTRSVMLLRRGGRSPKFMQVEITALDPDPDSDADGFIVQWGATPGTTRSWASRSLGSWLCQSTIQTW
jgi:hypothetical protein